MNIDWQAYEAGLLSPEQIQAAEALLASDPSARAELEGLRKLRQTIRQTRDLEAVPLDSLLGKIRHRPKVGLRPAHLGLIAAALVVISWVGYSSFKRAVGPSEFDVSSRAVSDPRQASDFLRGQTRLGITELDPRPIATIRSVSAAKSWVKYDLEFKGKPIEFRVSPTNRKVVRALCVTRDGVPFYVGSESGMETVVWRERDLEFSVSGAAKGESWPLVDDLHAKTAGWSLTR